MSDRTKKNCLSYWFPKIQKVGIPVPRTEIVRMEPAAAEQIFEAFDGKPIGDAAEPFFVRLSEAAEKIGYPLFLRTGQTSGKHGWKDTCHVPDASALRRHVLCIIEYSALVDFMGLPWDVWAVRELLPTNALAECPNYGDMPVVREFRFFAEDGVVKCFHPYWPKGALENGGCEFTSNIYGPLTRYTERDELEMRNLAVVASRAVGGSWSIDLLDVPGRGWVLTDMARAQDSFHWEGCSLTRASNGSIS